METINIQLQVPNTGKYTLDEFVSKVKAYANQLAHSLPKTSKAYEESAMTKEEQEAYVAETLNRALDEMEEHRRNGTQPMKARELFRMLEEEE